jgi:flagellar basal-body rod protein FlgG
MVRGMYTSASGMLAQMRNVDVVANNLANVNTTGFKRDTLMLKSFPEMMLSRLNDNGVVRIPIGSYDTGPQVGKLGTGVEVNRVITRFETNDADHIVPMIKTGNKYDIALHGEGFIALDTPRGEMYTRDGAFVVDNEGYLVTKAGNKVMGEAGPIQVGTKEIRIDDFGNVFVKPRNAIDWQKIDRIKIVGFNDVREIKKAGQNLYRATEDSGPATILEVTGNKRPKVIWQFLEGSNVNPVTEMVKLIEDQRTYEANAKMVQSHDNLLGRAVNDIARYS